MRVKSVQPGGCFEGGWAEMKTAPVNRRLFIKLVSPMTRIEPKIEDHMTHLIMKETYNKINVSRFRHPSSIKASPYDCI